MKPACESLVLASSSPRRAALLAELGVAFEVLACPLPEPAVRPPGIPPRGWAEALAYYKARAVAERRPGRWVLGADTLVVCGGRLLGKPADLDDARRMLELQAGRPTQVITGVGLVCCADAVRRLIASQVTTVWMRDAPEERERYLMSGDWQGKAGAYGIQTVGDRLVERVAGSFSNVVGLPAELVQVMLRTVGLAGRRRPARSTPRRCGGSGTKAFADEPDKGWNGAGGSGIVPGLSTAANRAPIPEAASARRGSAEASTRGRVCSPSDRCGVWPRNSTQLWAITSKRSRGTNC